MRIWPLLLCCTAACLIAAPAFLLHSTACEMHVAAVERYQRKWCAEFPDRGYCVSGDSDLWEYMYCKVVLRVRPS